MKCGASLALVAALAAVGVSGQGLLNVTRMPEYVLTPRMHEVLTEAALPSEVDWRFQGGNNYLTIARNQHIPMYCGSCYAFGATSVLADRIRIARGAMGREINLAVQVILNCDTMDDGCAGGVPQNTYAWIRKQGGIPDETCQPYEARGHNTGNTCNPKTICKRCDEFGCVAQESYPVYNVAEYGSVVGVFPMMAELQRGPITCGISTPPLFVSLSGWGIYEDLTKDTNPDHIISVVGYGSEDGKAYWILRNSWGTYWGYYGMARVVRGSNNILIEHDCAWATPSDGGMPTWRHADESKNIVEKASEVLSWMGKFSGGAQIETEASEPCRGEVTDWAAAGGERVESPRPHELLKPEELPSTWDWRNVSGKSFVTWNTNENVPKAGCASCWAHGVTSALSDRIAVKQNGQWPQIGLSPQTLINCHGGGGCSGGDPAGAYAYINKHGVTDQTCQNYQAEELPCDEANICMNCAPGGEHGLTWPGNCVAVQNPILWFVSEYGSVRGAFPMKAEIYKRGPIGCGLDATSGFRNYKGGIYSEPRSAIALNQQVSLAGWGAAGAGEAVPAGTEFWVGRNSWGTYWGEEGWFRIQMHENNLGVESDCDWGVPQDGPLVASAMLSGLRDTVPGSGQWPAFFGSATCAFAALGLALLLRRQVRAKREQEEEYLLLA